jgi:Ax21 family sulfation-dependent quorum factor
MKKTLFSLGLIAALPFAANAADGISYNYFEIGYVNTDTEYQDADGWGMRTSAAVAPNFHFFFGYSNQNSSHNHANDVNHWYIGPGYNREINQSIDLVSRIAYQRLGLGHGFNFHGYSAEMGIRAALNPKLEGLAMVGWEDYRRKRWIDPDSQFYLRLGAQWKFTRNFGIASDVKLTDGGDYEWFVGPRVNW